jgi:hypothetical protein
MKKLDFFVILIRISALYLIVITVISVASNVAFSFSSLGIAEFLAFLALSLVIPFIIAYMFISNSSEMVNFLKLNKGLDDDRIELGQLGSVQLFQIICLVFGFYLIVDGLPYFLFYLFYYLKSIVPKTYSDSLMYDGSITFQNSMDYFYLFSNGAYILIGYLILTNYKDLSELMNKKINN